MEIRRNFYLDKLIKRKNNGFIKVTKTSHTLNGLRTLKIQYFS